MKRAVVLGLTAALFLATQLLPAGDPTPEPGKEKKEPAKTDPPAPDKKVDPPAPDKKVDPPAPDKKVDPPAPDKKVDPPAPDKKVDPPAPDKKVDPPAPDKKVDPPAPDKKVDPPAPDKKVDPPAPDKKVDPPAPDKKVDPPAPAADKKDEEKPDPKKAARSRQMLPYILKAEKRDSKKWTLEGVVKSAMWSTPDGKTKSAFVNDEEEQKINQALKTNFVLVDCMSKVGLVTPLFIEVYCTPDEVMLKEVGAKFGPPDRREKGSFQKKGSPEPCDWHVYGSLKIGIIRDALVALRLDGPTWQSEDTVLPKSTQNPDTPKMDKTDPGKIKPPTQPSVQPTKPAVQPPIKKIEPPKKVEPPPAKRPDPVKAEKPPDPPPADPAEKAEQEAARKLKIARNLEEDGFVDKARPRYQEIVDKFSKTKAAEEAAQRLEKLKNKK